MQILLGILHIMWKNCPYLESCCEKAKQKIKMWIVLRPNTGKNVEIELVILLEIEKLQIKKEKEKKNC